MIGELLEIIKSNYVVGEYPTLALQMREWADKGFFSGVKLLDATPVFRNTIAKYIPLLVSGAQLSVGISNDVPRDDSVVALLRSLSIPIVDAKNVEGDFDIVMDCAAAFSHVDARVGYVELTRSGVSRYEHCTKPVFMADSGRIKAIETCLGTGEGYFRAMCKLGYSRWQGKKLVVFGSGKVGRGIITYGKYMGAQVIAVTEVATISESLRAMCDRVIDVSERAEIDSVLGDAYAVVTATGVVGAVERGCSADILIGSSALLANMGVEDEYGSSVPAERVLESKMPLNFILDEPTHMKYIDATMALHNAGALYLLSQRDLPSGAILPPADIEETLIDITKRKGIISDELALLFK